VRRGEIVLKPECLKQYANLTGTPYRKSAERLRYEMSERGKVVRRRRDESYISLAVWTTAAPYRVHVRREEDGMWGYRLERVDAPGSSSTGKGPQAASDQVNIMTGSLLGYGAASSSPILTWRMRCAWRLG
jgi:hypothetical protein